MSDLSISDVDAAVPTTEGEVADRRRPGRATTVSPALIPLLRAPHATTSVPTAEVENVDDMEDGEPFQAIVISLAIMVPFWFGIGYLVLR